MQIQSHATSDRVPFSTIRRRFESSPMPVQVTKLGRRSVSCRDGSVELNTGRAQVSTGPCPHWSLGTRFFLANICGGDHPDGPKKLKETGSV